MKVSIRKEDYRWIPVADMPTIRGIIADMKEDDAIKEYAEMAIRVALGGAYDISLYKVEACICRNSRIMNALSNTSLNYDVWITAHALTNKGFVIVGANLTDIWQITGRYGDDYNLRKYMFIRHFEEVSQ